MISEEVLKKLADGLDPKYCNCPEYEYGGFEILIVEMANEILNNRSALFQKREERQNNDKDR